MRLSWRVMCISLHYYMPRSSNSNQWLNLNQARRPINTSSYRTNWKINVLFDSLQQILILIIVIIIIRNHMSQSFLCSKAHCDSYDVNVNFLKAPSVISRLTRAAFEFEVLEGTSVCRNCSVKCKLDDYTLSDCGSRKVSYARLQDGKHAFEVCANGSRGVGCASYNWTVDIVPPTANVTATTAFTNALNISVDISFSELCAAGGAGFDSFECVSVNACNLLVYGPGQVIPSTLKILQPGLKYSLLVGLSSSVQYGRVILVMDKNFCADRAGNSFSRSKNSSFFVHFDRRNVFVNMRTHIPEKLLKLNSETRTVEATNNYKNLKLYLYFSQPVINSSAEILSSLNSSQGLLLPTNVKTNGNRRFGFLIKNLSSIAVVTISFDSSSIISRYGTLVSPIAPVTFLYDSERPSVRLSTTSNMRTRDHTVPAIIKFIKPVFGFNSSTLLISGGHLQSFHEISRSVYVVEIHADDEIISMHIPENISRDVAGNSNLASNVLQVRHYSVPIISSVLFTVITAAFAITSFAVGLLAVSTASLESIGASSRTSSFTTNPARNLFRIACHIQVFALSRWLAVSMPVEYYEFARGLQWSIPYLNLPWETGHIQTIMVDPSPIMAGVFKQQKSEAFKSEQLGSSDLVMDDSVFGLPLTPMEYRSFFESHDIKPEAEYIMEPQTSNGWKHFDRNMFWLAIFCGSLMLLHALVLFILKCRRKDSEDQRHYGVLILPRFEIFLVILALPSICQASTVLLKGGSISGVIVGILLLGTLSFLLVGLFLFLSIGITLGKLLQYKEVHQEGQNFHWYQNIIRVTLGPGKRGQWTWKNQSNSAHLLRLGPLFEDLRGPPKYMLSQISGGNPGKRGDRIIASDDETEDAEAPFIQKLFGILRIYYTLLESVKRAALGIVVGAYLASWSSRTPTLVLLCITSFQLFFLVLKKPFINKMVQLVEILSVASEVGIFALCLVLLEKEFSNAKETVIGIFMLVLFLIPFTAQMINEWYALYRLILQLDSTEKTFKSGLKKACVGLLLILIPWNLLKRLDNQFLSNNFGSGDNEEAIASGDRNSGSRSSGSTDRPWLRQLRELAKASFSKDDGVPKDPSSSRTQISDLWRGKRSGSSSVSSSADLKSRSRALYRDLEAIFSRK